MKLLDYLVICSCLVFVVAVSYPITSQPLTNNPETWALEDSWLVFNPKNSVSLAEPLIASYDLKAKKITPKSIFIAPNSNFLNGPCLPGQRIDENGKCIKVVTVNKDDLILHQLHQLLQKGEDPNGNLNIDYDYDYSDDEDDDDDDDDIDDFNEDKFEESQGPQRFVLPLVLENNSDFNKNVAEDDKFNNAFIVDEVSNITKLSNKSRDNQTIINKNDANLLQITKPASILTTTTPTPQTTTTVPIEDTTMSTMPETLPTEFFFPNDYDDEKEDDTTTLPQDTTTTLVPTTTINENDILSTTTETNEVTTMTTVPEESEETTTLFQKKLDTTEVPTTTETITTEDDTTTIRTTLEPISTRLKIHRTTNRKQQNATIISESPNYQRNNSRRQKTSPANRPDQRLSNTAIIDRTHLPKKESLTTLAYSQTTTTRVPKRRASTTIEPTTIPTTTTTSTTQSPYVWVPRGGDFSQRPQNKPVLIRFWSNMPLVQDNVSVRPIDQPNYNFNTNSNNNRNLNNNNNNFNSYNFNNNNNRPNFNTNPPSYNNNNRPTFNTNPPNPYNNYNYQRRRSHLPQTGSYRINSRQPSERLFREVSLQEVQSVL